MAITYRPTDPPTRFPDFRCTPAISQLLAEAARHPTPTLVGWCQFGNQHRITHTVELASRTTSIGCSGVCGEIDMVICPFQMKAAKGFGWAGQSRTDF